MDKVHMRGTYEYVNENPDLEGPPLNPFGRTGVCGVGQLRRFGPNHAVDLCVTRRDPHTHAFQILVLKTYDLTEETEEGAQSVCYRLPGGEIDDFELSTREMMKTVGKHAVHLVPPSAPSPPPFPSPGALPRVSPSNLL